jgi:hypothetical protein
MQPVGMQMRPSLHRSPLRSLQAAMVLALLCTGAGATSICRWVDQAGRTQFAEVVPEKYKHVATCTDSQRYELSAAQRQAAELRLAQEKARAREAAARPPPAGTAISPRAARAASGADVKRPIERVTDATDCPAWWRIYDESVECFGPYRTTRGATKPEAFDKCNVIPSPEPQCGPRSR